MKLGEGIQDPIEATRDKCIEALGPSPSTSALLVLKLKMCEFELERWNVEDDLYEPSDRSDEAKLNRRETKTRRLDEMLRRLILRKKQLEGTGEEPWVERTEGPELGFVVARIKEVQKQHRAAKREAVRFAAAMKK